MKKTIFLLIALSFGLIVNAQKGAGIKKELFNKSATRSINIDYSKISDKVLPVNPSAEGTGSVYDNVIGHTYYDLQSNAALANRIWAFDDGTIAAVWTRGVQNPPGFPDRGTGYNYFDGTSWGSEPTERIESVRAGWPSIAAWGPSGEIVSAHDFSLGKIILNMRPNKGTGDWTETFLDGPDNHFVSWSRIMTSGDNHDIIHLLCVTKADDPYNGQNGALFYSRTDDGGETWDPYMTVLDDVGPDYYNGITADDYVWAESRGDVIAFLVVNPWYDLFFMKSEDNGDEWEKTVVWEHPYPFFDWNSTITTDTIWAPDGSGDIAIDNDGKVHIVFGLTRVAHTEVGNTYTYWPYTDGIIYWNEDMPPFTASNQHRALAYENLVEDETLIGWTQDVNGDGEITFLDELQSYRELGISTMPNILASSYDNSIFVVWASTTETYENGTMNFKHIWTRTSYNSGETWSSFCDLNSDIIHWLDECIYPVLAGDIDINSGYPAMAHVIYQADAIPGTALDGDHDWVENKIYYSKFESCTYTGVNTTQADKGFNVSQNNPNPFNDKSIINVDLSEKGKVYLVLKNLAGQTVYSENKRTENNSCSFVINAKGLTPGVYFYTITAGNNSVTKKMIVK